MLWLTLAFAADVPDEKPSTKRPTDVNHFFYRGFGAFVVPQAGVYVDVAAEFRVPILRFGGAAFNNGFIGAGMRAGMSPVHLDLAARVSFLPIDLLPITVEGFWGNYWDSPWGPVPVDRVKGQLLPDRRHLYQENRDFRGNTIGISFIPTFQFKVSRIVGVTSWTFTFMKFIPEEGTPDSPEPYYFEPFRGMVLAYEDRVIEHISPLLWEFKSGEDHSALFRLGAVGRGKFAKNTTDHTLQLGGIMMWRPGKTLAAPTLTMMVTPYIIDPDFNTGIPYLGLVLSAGKSVPLQRL